MTFQHSTHIAQSAAVARHGTPSRNTWQALQVQILERIRSGEWPPGTLIPTELELAKTFGCARATVNRAMSELAREGIVERRRRVGTRVVDIKGRLASIELPSFANEIKEHNASFGYRLLHLSQEMPPAFARSALQLRRGESCLMTRSLFLADERPYCCEERFSRLEGLDAISPEFWRETSLDCWMAAQQLFSPGPRELCAQQPSPTIAAALQLEQNMPVLTATRSWWRNFAPVSVSRSFYPPGHSVVVDG